MICSFYSMKKLANPDTWDIPGSRPAAVTPRFSNVSISRKSRSAERSSGSRSASSVSSSDGDSVSYVDGPSGLEVGFVAEERANKFAYSSSSGSRKLA
jgi:hypothetical protein